MNIIFNIIIDIINIFFFRTFVANEFMRVNGLLPPEIGGAGNVNYYDLSPTVSYESADDSGDAELRTGYVRERYKK